MRTGVVITYGAGREENVSRVLAALDELIIEEPEAIVIVQDGTDVGLPMPTRQYDRLDFILSTIKHEPGREQPRNLGVRHLVHYLPDVTHVWFLDSDILVYPNALQYYAEAAAEVGDNAILIGPYDWMPEGMREPMPDLYNDPRWAMFNERDMGPFVADLGVALGCFGGNLVWPVEQFKRIGGFHPQLHHGRCEDGELGLRAAAHRIPMALVPGARGFHMAHPVNHELAMERNRRDVPLLNAWHPWVEQKGLIVTDQDGARFDFVCACGEQVNTLAMWEHMGRQHHQPERPAPDLILPEGL